MKSSTKITKWGNSLGLRLSESLAAEIMIAEGDTVELSVQDGGIFIRPTKRTYSLQELVDRITPRNRHTETDWGKPVGANGGSEVVCS